MANAFMQSAERSKREQKKIQHNETLENEGFRILNVRVPESLHRKAQFHRIETGENVTQLVNRLLAEELDD